MNSVNASTAEAELGGLFHNGKDAEPICQTLMDIGYPQPPTPTVTDKVRVEGITNDTVKQRRSKAIYMRFYWIRDQVKQGHFTVR